jgi:prepilin-type N-terminal cleavage/methylation domain-containing protein
MMLHYHRDGFTLAELLIVMGILSFVLVVSFAKTLTAFRATQYNATAKEAASLITSAYVSYKNDKGIVPATFKGADLLPYMNVISEDITSIIQDNESSSPSTFACADSWVQCYALHNGAVIVFFPFNEFGLQQNDHFIWIELDPDGAGPAYSVTLLLFYNGRLSSEGDAGGATKSWGTLYTGLLPCVLCNPSWWKQWK